MQSRLLAVLVLLSLAIPATALAGPRGPQPANHTRPTPQLAWAGQGLDGTSGPPQSAASPQAGPGANITVTTLAAAVSGSAAMWTIRQASCTSSTARSRITLRQMREALSSVGPSRPTLKRWSHRSTQSYQVIRRRPEQIAGMIQEG